MCLSLYDIIIELIDTLYYKKYNINNENITVNITVSEAHAIIVYLK